MYLVKKVERYNSPMAEVKTKATNQNPKDFLDSTEPEQKRLDGLALLEMFEKVTGEKAVMWGTSIVGFGKYHYKSEKSRPNSSSKTHRNFVSVHEKEEYLNLLQ